MKQVRSHHQLGQSLVEFALILPILVLLLVGIFDLGRVVYYYSALQNAAREGARYGIVHPNDSAGVEAAVRNKAIGLVPAELSVYPPSCCPWPAGETIIVRATYRFTPITPIIGAFLPSGITLVSSSTMWKEY